MRPTECPPHWPGTRDSGTAPIGPAMMTLRSVIARLASVVRCAGIVYIAVQVAIWPSFYAADPWRLAAPVAAAAWAAAAIACLRRTWPAPSLACLDSAAYVALALAAEAGVPPAVRDHAYSWLVIVMSSQLIVPAWFAPATLRVPLALASPAAYLIGAELAPGTGRRMTVAAAVLLVVVVSVHSYGSRALYRRAAAADAALAEADLAAAGQHVILTRNVERREHERLLHDTVLNTLTALGRAGSSDPGDRGDAAAAVSRARQDVTLIEAALSDPDPDGSAAAGGPGKFSTAADGDLISGVREIAAAMSARGLRVHVQVAGVPAVPAPVAVALANATREALSNVAAHAGTADAWVEVSRVGPDGGTADGSTAAGGAGAQVTVRDAGAGFDPARVDRARLGLRRSITERVADCGGHASVWSAPGHGTVVRLSWPARPPGDEQGVPASLAPAGEAPRW
jgi:signal transduction histidine kinase